MNRKVLVLVVLAMLSAPAHSEVALQVHGISYHTFRNGLNEVNPGLGLRLRSDDGITASAGFYKNSYSRQTNYITLGKTWVSGKFEYGIEAAAATGYKCNRLIPLPVVGYGPVKVRIIPKERPVFTASFEIKLGGGR